MNWSQIHAQRENIFLHHKILSVQYEIVHNSGKLFAKKDNKVKISFVWFHRICKRNTKKLHSILNCIQAT